MAIVQGLFGIDPEAMQAQREAALQREAFNFAQLSPQQQAQMGFYTAGSRLGTGLAGLMGAKDPEMERLRMRQSLMQDVDANDPMSLRQAAAKAQSSGDYSAAMELVNRATAVEKALADISKTRAETIRALREKEAADPLQKLIETGRYTPKSVAKYKESGNIADLEPTDKTPSFGTDAEVAARALYGKPFASLDQAEAAEVMKQIQQAGEKKAKAGATNISQVVTNKAAEQFGSKFGQLTGEQAAQIEGKYSALDYIGEAKKMLDKGIYAGLFGPEKLLAVKASSGLIGDIEKAENTEQFVSYIGNIVIPRLQEFGGNDSVEELNYLRKVVAGDQRLETRSMKAILDRAERAINRGIERTKRSVSAVGGAGMAPLDAGPSREAPKATLRWNPETSKLEPVK